MEKGISHNEPRCFFLFVDFMCARGVAHLPSTRMHSYALKGLYIFADLVFQCFHVVHFVSCF